MQAKIAVAVGRRSPEACPFAKEAIAAASGVGLSGAAADEGVFIGKRIRIVHSVLLTRVVTEKCVVGLGRVQLARTLAEERVVGARLIIESRGLAKKRVVGSGVI